ncbi:unnamed protein product [Rotaria sp. Silwood2]|nr:unnamed protein product [Rotaria sp. Silwood2]CAF4732649.1 unnamed protein product [Rotaria sp. Silwood2]
MLNNVPRRYLVISLFIVCWTLIYKIYVTPSHSRFSFTANEKNQNTKQYEISTWRELFQLKAGLALSSQSIAEYYKVDGFHLNKEQWNTLACTLAKPAGIISGSSVIDFGCGVGAFLYEISTRCGVKSNIHVFGIDFAPTMIQIADQWLTPSVDRDAGIQHFWIADITNASIVPSNSFTHAVSHSVFQYLQTYQNAFDALSEMARVVRENGTIALLDLNDAAKRSEALKSYRRDKNRGEIS